MSINLQRDSNNKVIKKKVQFTSTPSLSNNSFALQNPNNVNLTSLSLNGVNITTSGSQLNTLNVTPGTASSNKALVTNSSNSISNVGGITCTTLTVNGSNISGIVSSSGGDSDSPYMNDITIGNASSNKSIVFDGNININDINTIGTNTLSIKNSSLSATNIKYTKQCNMIYSCSYNTINTTGLMKSICYSPQLNLLVSVGTTSPNFIMTSTNGTSWTVRTCPTSVNQWNSICWSAELSLFVAISSNCTTSDGVMTSPDGINWTSIAIPAANNWTSVCWASSLSLFVAVSNNGTTANCIMTSPNGTTWTSRTCPNALAWTSICWSNELTLFVAVASNGTTANQIVYSTNGTSWTAASTPNANQWTSICWSPELSLFAVVSATGAGNRVMTSLNGISWATRTSAANNNWISIEWSSKLELFVAISTNGMLMCSNNGTNWFLRSSTSLYIFSSLCWNSNLNSFIICGSTNSSPYNPVFGISNKVINSDIYTQPAASSIISNLQIVMPNSITSNVAYKSACWSTELGIYVAVASGATDNAAKIMISSDGVNWLYITIPNTTSGWGSICWSPQLCLFVVLANTSVAAIYGSMTSPDGINWTVRTLSTGNSTWKSICWSPELSLFVGVADTGTIRMITSPDGVNWTNITLPVANTWVSICWSSELSLFVAVSSNTVTTYNTITSSNGTNWAIVSTGTSINNISSICWSSKLGMFLTCSLNTQNTCAISYDGSIWISSTFTAVSGFTRACCWCDKLGVFIMMSSVHPNNVISYSFNGINWYNILGTSANMGSPLPMSAICWSSELSNFIIFTSTGNLLLKSVDVKETLSINLNKLYNMSNNIVNNSINNNQISKYWYSKSSIANNSWSSVIFSEELCTIVAISSDGTTSNNIMTSIDGDNWISRTSPNTNIWTSICFSDELVLFAAVASSGTGNRVMTSSDSITWTSRSSAVDNNWTSVCWSSELTLFVAVSSTGTGNRVMTSPDGTNWTSRSSASNNNWTSVCWSSNLNLFVAVSSSGTGNRVMTSSDGITWTIRSSAVDNNWSSVCWSSYLSLFVAVSSSGTSNRVMTSSNGINWTTRISILDNNWTSVCWSIDLKVFMAVSSSGTGNRVMSSVDGINWFTQTPAVDNDWQSVTWCNSLSIFIAVSNSETDNRIMKSNIALPTYKTAASPANQLQLYCLNVGNTVSNTNQGPMYQINSNIYQTTLTPKLSINTSVTYNYGCMRLVNNSSNSNYVDFDLNSDTTQLKITVNGTNKVFNIVNHNGSTTGLQIGNTLVTAQGSDFNLLNSTPGTASASKILITDSSKNILGINNISVNAMYINGKLLLNDSANNSSYFTNVTPGTATASSFIVTNSNNSISGINKLSSTSININKTNIINNKMSYTNINKSFSSLKSYNNYPSNIIPNSIAYSPSLGIIVAVGYCWNTSASTSIYNIMYSYNGIDWYAARTPIQMTLRSVCWSPELAIFVAVAASSVSITAGNYDLYLTVYSKDGINWINGTSVYQILESVCWGPGAGLFVAVGRSTAGALYTIITSTDGKTWTARTSPNNKLWNSVCWAPALNLFVAVSDTSATGLGQVITSPDGITWTQRTPGSASLWKSVCWSPTLSLLVAVGGAVIMSSPDGINWTLRTPAFTNNWTSVCWSSYANAFIAVSTSGTANRIIKSSDGTSWTAINTTGKDTTYSCIASIDSLNLLLTATTSTTDIYFTNKIAICTNSDASSWTFVPTSYDLGFNRIIYADSLNLLVTCGNYGQKNILTSSNGKNWTIQTPANLNIYFNDIVWASSLSLIVCISNGIINRSSDGINWISSSTPTGNWNSICWAPSLNLFVAIAASNAGTNFMRSSNGYVWTTFAVTGANWQDICWSSTLSLFVAVDFSSGSIATSNNGINWIVITTSKAFYTIQWISELSIFMAVSTTGYSLSSDGINWIHYSNIIYNSITYTFANSRFNYMSQYSILVGTCKQNSINYICYSYDAINWVTVSFPLNTNISHFISVPELNVSIFHTSAVNKPFCPFLIFDYNEYVNNYDINYNLTNLNNQVLPDSTLVSNAISNYYTRTNPSNLNYSSICWSSKLSKFIICTGDAVDQLTSSLDGINYTVASAVNCSRVSSICWSPEFSIFAAVFQGNSTSKVITSSDAITWTTIVTPVDILYTSICWSSDLLLFVAVASTGTNNRILISPDGINWSISINPIDNNWTSVCWAKYMGLFVAVASTGTNNRVMTSPDGITWTTRTSAANNSWNSICYNSYSNLLVAVSNNGTNSNNVMISSNGSNWTAVTTSTLNYWNSVCWSPELNVFMAVASSGTGNRVMTSYDGTTWTIRTSVADNDWTSVCWSPELNIFVAVASSGTGNRIMTTLPILPALKSTIISSNKNTLYVDQNNGNIGLGTQVPAFQLQLSTDSAAKPSTSTWTVSSDERLKDNIVDANLDLCYDNIKNLKLKRYTWKDDVYTSEQVSDRSKLGWIAQEVETVFPKAVEKHDMHGYEDCRTLNSDQIIASMYGCLKKLINIYDNQTTELDTLDTNLTRLQNMVDEITK